MGRRDSAREPFFVEDAAARETRRVLWVVLWLNLGVAAAKHGLDFSSATLWPDWTLDDFSGDYFHPDLSGESRLAAAVWPEVAA